MSTPPFGYCPECDAAGVEEDFGVVKCTKGHKYPLDKAKWPEKMQNRKDLEADAKALMEEATEDTILANGPTQLKVTRSDVGDVDDFVKAAKEVKATQVKLQKRFKEIHKILKDLVEEIESYV